jgi:HK97 family phage prohead protease
MNETTAEWRRTKAAQLGGIERRELLVPGLELRDQDSDIWTLTGFASVTGVDYDMGPFVERIEPGAFKRTLGERPDVQLLVNHAGLPISRTRSGTLRLEERLEPDASGRRGLWIEADLDKSDPDAQVLERKVRRGLMDGMSFAFQVTDDSWNADYSRRTIKTVNLNRGDVSVVNYGANPAATVANVRAAADVARAQAPLPDYTTRAREVLVLLQAGGRVRVNPRKRGLAAAPPSAPDYLAVARQRLAELRKGQQ